MKAALLISVLFASTALFAGGEKPKQKEDSKVARGLQISPVPIRIDNTTNKSVVGMGSYLVNAASSCANCHTCPTFTPGLKEKHKPVNAGNFMAGGVPFAVPAPAGGATASELRSANLTPDAHGLPGGLTFLQFEEALTEGHKSLTEAFSQFPSPSESYSGEISVMPWRIYRNFETADLEAIYEYLKAIPPAKPGACTGPGE